tara:strand:+ start:2964 stop:3302 length:339 start_codon:yes stop_codon:yes gene_type:complete
MFNIKFLISSIIFVSLLIITSTIKNKTRIIEKNITSLNKIILSKKKDKNETQLDFYYLSSPQEIEKRLNLIGFDNYKAISYSRIYLNISDFTQLNKKITNLKSSNEKKIKKK